MFVSYFVMLESVLYISFNLHEFNLSLLMGDRLLQIFISLKSSGGAELCTREVKDTKV